MNVKILGAGCPSCQIMYNDVTRIVARNGWKFEVEYIQDITQILTYRLTAIPAMVINEEVVMVGHRGPSKIEQALRNALESQFA